jgi:hypothetical protein
LSLLRTIFAFLIALSLATTPVGAAMAASFMATNSAHGDMPGMAADMSDMAGMDDCAKMRQSADNSGSKSDCTCCDTKSKCPPDLCLSKCFKVLGDLVRPEVVRPPVVQLRHAEGPLKPPDRSWAPQPPPPRT